MSEHINVQPNLEPAMPFTQEWYGDRADNVMSAADEQELEAYMNSREFNEAETKWQSEKDEC
jgi:hypothetical protein